MLNLYKWYSASSDWLCFIWRSCAHYQMCSRYHWNWKWLLSMYLWIDYWTWKFVWPRLALLKDLLPYLLFNIENKSNCDNILQVFYVFELFWKVKIVKKGCTYSCNFCWLLGALDLSINLNPKLNFGFWFLMNTYSTKVSHRAGPLFKIQQILPKKAIICL